MYKHTHMPIPYETKPHDQTEGVILFPLNVNQSH